MKITSAEFITSAIKSSHFPGTGLPEVALIGKSNVGKSSLINSLTNRKSLAKTSSSPGKTRTINFYLLNDSFYIVDLPGFGYAKVPQSVKATWEKMIEGYFESRIIGLDGAGERSLIKGALVILDPRRDAGEDERLLYRWIEGFNIPAATVFTKTDKLSRNVLSSRIAAIKKTLPVKAPVLFSAVTGDGKEDLKKKIEGFLMPEQG